MSHIVILEERCKGCLLCTIVCPKEILQKSGRFNRQGYEVVAVNDAVDECTGCASCGIICPDVALRVFRSARAEGEV